MTEKQWQQQVVDLAQVYGWLVYHTYDSRRSEPGFPDLVMVHKGQERVIYAELKTARGSLTPDQHEWLRALQACGCEVYLWRPYDFGDVIEILRPRLPTSAKGVSG